MAGGCRLLGCGGSVASEDGLQTVVRTTGKLGTTLVSVSADADLGESARAVSAVLDVTVQAVEVVSAGITAGTPRVKSAQVNA